MAYTWEPFFNELFIQVTRDFTKESLAKVAYEIFPETGLMDRDVNNNQVRLTELEPCTFLARFNRKEDDQKRIVYCKKAKEVLKLKSAVPSDFMGIPTFNPQSAWLFPFQRDRVGTEMDSLWAFSRDLAKGTLQQRTFEDALKVRFAGAAYLTTICFIVWPEKFLPLDRRTKSLFDSVEPATSKLFALKTSQHPFSDYMTILAAMKRLYPWKNPKELSHEAFLRLEEADELSEPTETKISHEQGVQYWTMSAGEEASEWDDWIAKSEISIGWDELGDISSYTTLEELKAYYIEKYNPERNPMNNARACFEFAKALRPGDIIFAKAGRRELLGVAEVTGEYSFDKSKSQYKHVRKVRWIRVNEDGDWKLPKDNQMALKALTNITPYPAFVDLLLKTTGLAPSGQSESSEGVSALSPSAGEIDLALRNLNTIFYGPPGTGKTHKLLSLQRLFVSTGGKSAAIAAWVEERTWWEVIAAALIEFNRPVTVREISEHELIKVKTQQSSTVTPKNSIWTFLQQHTVDGSTTVRHKYRIEPQVVDKSEDSRWQLVGNWQEQLEDIVHDLKVLRSQDPGETYEQRFVTVTFHQSYSYEDFVEGIRPVASEDGNGVTYEVKDGIFKKICLRAQQNPTQKFAIFIDEINRGNVSRVFGELITLIEEDKRIGGTSQIKLTLPYSGQNFGVPSNLYIVGTMNSVDRSVALVDMALRRRFDFVNVVPSADLVDTDGVSEFDVQHVFERLNEKIAVILGPEYQLGHSYFMGKKVSSLAAFRRTWFGSILPLIQEYLFDDWEKIKALVGDFAETREVSGLEHLNLARTSYGRFVDPGLSDEEFIRMIQALG